MKQIVFLLLLYLINCFTVYKKDETVLKRETLITKDIKEERDVYILAPTLNQKGLHLFLDAYRVEEKGKVNFIREKYLENKDFKLEDKYSLGNKECRGNECIGWAIIVTTYMALELSTIPVRLISFPQERIREDIKKGNVSKIKSISTDDVYFILSDKNSDKKYNFQNDRIFIPTVELNLNSNNSKNFPYQLADNKTKKIILSGSFDFTESISKYEELEAVLEENNLQNKLSECQLMFPNFSSSAVTYSKAKLEMENLCSKYAAREVSDPNQSQSKVTYCYNNFEGCYYLTKAAKKTKN